MVVMARWMMLAISGVMMVRISDDSTAQLESLSFSVPVPEGVYDFLKTHT